MIRDIFGIEIKFVLTYGVVDPYMTDVGEYIRLGGRHGFRFMHPSSVIVMDSTSVLHCLCVLSDGRLKPQSLSSTCDRTVFKRWPICKRFNSFSDCLQKVMKKCQKMELAQSIQRRTNLLFLFKKQIIVLMTLRN